MFGCCHLRSVPQGGCHRVAPKGFAKAPDATAPLPRPTHQPTNQQTLNKLSSSSSSPNLLEEEGGWVRCQTDRTTKLLRRVKVPRGARRAERNKERSKKESGLDHPPLHHPALTQSRFFQQLAPALRLLLNLLQTLPPSRWTD